jgi:sulfur relay (sulfurtransferase) DsrC/TusE family protein
MRSLQMSNLNSIQGLKQFTADLEAFLHDSPTTEDAYLKALRSWSATLATALGKAEASMSRQMANVIAKTDDETFKRFKHSSTLVTQYTQGLIPDATAVYHELQYLKQAVRDASSQLTTMIAYRREELNIHNYQVSNQNNR